MSEMQDLYQEIILDHNRKPRNFTIPAHANHTAVGHNPLCGDQITVLVELDGGVIKTIGFQGAGCAISKASASLMTEAVKGRTIDEAKVIFEGFHDMVTGVAGAEPEALGKLAAFAGVCEYPARVKCASLAWHTLQAAITEGPTQVSTE
jgi:nitrogen fixation NifU-like protein